MFKYLVVCEDNKNSHPVRAIRVKVLPVAGNHYRPPGYKVEAGGGWQVGVYPSDLFYDKEEDVMCRHGYPIKKEEV